MSVKLITVFLFIHLPVLHYVCIVQCFHLQGRWLKIKIKIKMMSIIIKIKCHFLILDKTYSDLFLKSASLKPVWQCKSLSFIIMEGVTDKIKLLYCLLVMVVWLSKEIPATGMKATNSISITITTWQSQREHNVTVSITITTWQSQREHNVTVSITITTWQSQREHNVTV